MKKLLAMAVAASALAVAAPAAAQGWQSINQRQANLDARIDAGVRNGSLTRAEAGRLRGEFNGLVRLESRYRSSYGLSLSERADLDRRFDALSAQIRYQRNDNDNRWDRDGRNGRGWTPINQRQRQLDRRIDIGLRTGGLSQREAYGLRVEFNRIARLEAQYRRNGLNTAERRDLDRRFDRLSYRVEAELRDNNNRFG
jgi:opacity protein-like surface antigen